MRSNECATYVPFAHYSHRSTSPHAAHHFIGTFIARSSFLVSADIYSKGEMLMYVAVQPLVALIAGLLILIIPRLLNYIVALYLIIVGILGLFPAR